MNTQKNKIQYANYTSSEIGEMLLESIAEAQAFATASGYRQNGDFPSRAAFELPLQDVSFSMNKRLIKQHFHLKRKLSMRSANRFLHFIAVKLLAYGPELKVPRIEYSEKESAIKASRAAWVKARNEAEALRLAYVQEKGDFYKH